MRWRDYILANDDEAQAVEQLWRLGRPTSGQTLYVLGEGFDPRALVGLERFLAVEPLPDAVTVVPIELRRRRASSTAVSLTRKLAESNRSRLSEVLRSKGVNEMRLSYPQVVDPASAGLGIARKLAELASQEAVGRVVIDISALPGGIHFPVIGALLNVSDKRDLGLEVQVVVCENPSIDAVIEEEGVGKGAPIGGFRNRLDQQATKSTIRVWAPVLGEKNAASLKALYARLEPQEICPVLPFPARNPRRADDLILEYRGLLFDIMEVEPRNFIYADERNPFDLYRALSRLQGRYSKIMEPLDGATVVLSAHSSKLLSMGVLLAAYEFSLPVVSAGASNYLVTPEINLDELAKQNRLTCLWLSGAPYK